MVIPACEQDVPANPYRGEAAGGARHRARCARLHVVSVEKHPFSVESLRDLPNLEDLKASGLLDPRPVLTSIQGGVGELNKCRISYRSAGALSRATS